MRGKTVPVRIRLRVPCPQHLAQWKSAVSGWRKPLVRFQQC